MRDKSKTLAFAVAFSFSDKCDFTMGGKMYQRIDTIYDSREDGRGYNTLEIVYDYSTQKYKVLCVDDERIGEKEVRIL